MSRPPYRASTPTQQPQQQRPQSIFDKFKSDEDDDAFSQAFGLSTATPTVTATPMIPTTTPTAMPPSAHVSSHSGITQSERARAPPTGVMSSVDVSINPPPPAHVHTPSYNSGGVGVVSHTTSSTQTNIAPNVSSYGSSQGYPQTRMYTPNYESQALVESDKISIINNQIQREKMSHDTTKKKLESAIEEKTHLSREISSLRQQLENLESEITQLTQTIDRTNNTKAKNASETALLQAKLDAEIKRINMELEKEKNVQLELTIETSHLKAKVDQAARANQSLSNESSTLRSQSEKDRETLQKIEAENTQFRENWSEMLEKLEYEKSSKLALTNELQDLRKQLKLQESIQASCADLTLKIELLDSQLHKEQSLRAETDTIYRSLQNRFVELEKKRTDFENLSAFSQKLVQTVPSFTENVTNITKHINEHAVNLNHGDANSSIQQFLEQFRQFTQEEFRKQSAYVESIVSLTCPPSSEQITQQ
eukprot:TRINITY_DN2391_c3_g1_i1.p1 TRINITY_DN2391_c3_g1~~TRINITY_DN2391_c3_g1_i1.p1  ORF type:complete len:507 (+),score=104.06 TRINITY_DN2391_c3_g1_i1:79-1521(+)